MLFEQFVDQDLGHVSYIVACDVSKEAFIVDPKRDIQDYIIYLTSNGLNLKYIFNTHTHADYVGGHLELTSVYTNASNIFQKDVPIKNYDCIRVSNADQLSIGMLTVKVLETPGHTPFDISLLISENTIEKFVFTGDFLFIGDIGRPDLLGEENKLILLQQSYQSAKKLWTLKDDIIIFSSHINGSLCGKNLSKQYFSTIGIEKQSNCSFKLSQESQEEYMNNISSQNIETPAFFKKMAGLNIEGPILLEDIKSNILYLTCEDLKSISKSQIVDLRSPEKFNNFHVKGAINIYENANVSLLAGNILNYEDDIYLFGDDETDFDMLMTKLFRVGLDKVCGIINQPCRDFPFGEKSKFITRDEINFETVQIVLDKECEEITSLKIFSSINTFKELDISKYDKVFVSCLYGNKSSAIASYLMQENNNIYFLK